MTPRTPARLSLLRKIAWLGGDRGVVGFGLLICSLLGWTMFNGYGFNYGIPILLPLVIFAAILWIARRAFKADPWMTGVLIRHFQYHRYYAPKSHRGIPPFSVKDYKA